MILSFAFLECGAEHRFPSRRETKSERLSNYHRHSTRELHPSNPDRQAPSNKDDTTWMAAGSPTDIDYISYEQIGVAITPDEDIDFGMM
ncbi:MAG: hypothetical protein ACI9UA_002224 [Pseudoalteromonas tetraodonis]|jgi:hypothetical protein